MVNMDFFKINSQRPQMNVDFFNIFLDTPNEGKFLKKYFKIPVTGKYLFNIFSETTNEG